MYADPRLVRERVIVLRLNEEELKIVKAAAEKVDLQFSAFCREAAMRRLRALLIEHEKNFASPATCNAMGNPDTDL